MTARAAPLIVLLLTAFLLSACAGTARGVKESVYRYDASVEVFDRSRSDADAMVVIRYPATVEDAALPLYFRAFSDHPIGPEIRSGDTPQQEHDRIAQGLDGAKQGSATLEDLSDAFESAEVAMHGIVAKLATGRD